MSVARSLFIAIPVYGGADPSFAASLRKLERTLDKVGLRHIVVELPGESLITRARNRLVAMFLKSGCTDMLFLDSDIIFESSDVLRLVHSGHAFCAAPYPAKAPGGRLIGNPLVVDGQAKMVDGWVSAQDLPTGFMLIARSVFEEMLKAAPVPEVDDDLPGSDMGSYYTFFDTGADERQYLSEDWWFSRAARACGVDAWLDARAKLKHVGRYAYEAPSLEETLVPEGGPTEEQKARYPHPFGEAAKRAL
jgi:hypothetical protein